jgi:hypothetical protein
MAGILANSVTVAMGSGDSAADKSVSGYITNEAITLTTSPAGSTYAWALGKPSGSTARANLSAATGASVSFTPDIAGYYNVACTVDSVTTYLLRVSITQVAQTTSYEAIRFSPKSDASVPTPALGSVMYFSTTQNALAVKLADGSVHTVDLTAVV